MNISVHPFFIFKILKSLKIYISVICESNKNKKALEKIPFKFCKKIYHKT